MNLFGDHVGEESKRGTERKRKKNLQKIIHKSEMERKSFNFCAKNSAFKCYY